MMYYFGENVDKNKPHKPGKIDQSLIDAILVPAVESRFDENQTFITMEVLEYLAKQKKKNNLTFSRLA